MSAPQGTTYRFSANVWDSLGNPIDADTLNLTVYDPAYEVVPGFPISIGGLVHDGTGQYYYDWAIPIDATLGLYTAAWTGTITDPSEGESVVNGSETVEVVAATPVIATDIQGLLSSAELAALQADFVGLVMVTEITIYHQTVNLVGGGSYAYGDDDVRYLGDTIAGSGVSSQAWVISKPSVNALDNAGMIQTISPGTMRLPWGTSVFAGDELAVGTDRYVVIDVHTDETWPVWLLITFQSAQEVYSP